jgi:hypothetical protein
MFIFILIFFLLNFLAAIGYEDILRLSDRGLKIYWTVTTVGMWVVFFTMPSIMVELIVGVFFYQLIGFILYIGKCMKYNRDKEKEINSW